MQWVPDLVDTLRERPSGERVVQEVPAFGRVARIFLVVSFGCCANNDEVGQGATLFSVINPTTGWGQRRRWGCPFRRIASGAKIMKKEFAGKWRVVGWLVLLLLAPGWVAAQVTFDRIVVFGTSLSDPGNVFALTGQENTPPYNKLDPSDPFLIPSAPYARGGHHFSDGSTWIEQFAESHALAANTRPAFRASNDHASNYAVGGARARNAGELSLSAQVSRFLADFGGVAPAGGLYVVEAGSNDVRDAFVALAMGGDGSGVISAALMAIQENIALLHVKGARKFLVANVPDLGLTPAVQRLDQASPGANAKLALSSLSLNFNIGLADLLTGLRANYSDSQFVLLNVFQTVNDLTQSPSTFGLRDVSTPCVTPNVAPFTCRDPGDFLFWDGIHPTRTVHAIFSQKAAQALSE